MQKPKVILEFRAKLETNTEMGITLKIPLSEIADDTAKYESTLDTTTFPLEYRIKIPKGAMLLYGRPVHFVEE